MNWGGWAEWSALGGHAIYVLAAYVMTAGVLVIETVLVALRSQNIRRFLNEDPVDAGAPKSRPTEIADQAP